MTPRAKSNDPSNTIASVETLHGRGVADVASYGALPYRFVEAPGMVAIETVAGVRSPVQSRPRSSRFCAIVPSKHSRRALRRRCDRPAYSTTLKRKRRRMRQTCRAECAATPERAHRRRPSLRLDQASEGTFAIFDLGGGTFDSPSRAHARRLRSACHQWRLGVGGDDFDQAIATHWRVVTN